MKKIGKKLLSVLLVLCIAVSMMVMAMPSTQAAGGLWLKKKALDLGLRFACAAATQLAAQCENDDASIVVNSVIKYIIQDAHGAATSEIKSMCQDILAELTILGENVKEYTSEISSTLAKIREDDKREDFEQKWGSDVSDIVEEYRVNDILNSYTKYLIVSTLYSGGKPDDVTFEAIEDYWSTLSAEELSYSYDDYIRYKNEFVEFLGKHVSDKNNPEDSLVYGNAQIFSDIKHAIEDLADKFVYDDVSNHSEQYSVLECAATLAYYALPFSSQQYEYTVTQGKRQIMVATLLEMALNEYLALQGEYIVKNNLETLELEYTLGSYNDSMTYAQCKESYQELTETLLKKTCDMFESSITVNCKPYTGEPSYECTLDDYMKPEDAVATQLNINGYEGSHTYSEEKQGTEMWHMYSWSNMTSNASSTSQKMDFIRVMPGGNTGEVYYILDASQYDNASYLDFTKLKHRVKREYVTDGGVGDLHIVSCDYYNFIKQMTDGVNTYKMPDLENLDTELASLIDVPIYSASSEYILSDFLAPFAPANVWNGGCSKELRILTSSYDNNLKDGVPTAVKRADVSVVDATAKGENTNRLVTEDIQLHEDMGSKDYSYLVILASDSDEAYKQNVSIKYDDPQGIFPQSENFIKIENQGELYYGETAALEPGTKLTIHFWVDDPGEFDSLKMVRKNSENSETVLISGYEELSYYEYANGTGYYTIDVTMPYSEVEFLFTSKENEFPTVTINKIDPANTVSDCKVNYNNWGEILFGETENIVPGTALEVKFSLSNVSTFKALAAYDPATEEITVLADSDTLLDLDKVGSYYCYYTTMPDSAVEYYVVTNEPEEFVPQELETDEEGTFLISNYEELRSASYYINTGEEKYTAGNYKVINDINCMNAGLEPLANSEDNLFTGSFDGQGYTISNYKIYTSTYNAALFGEVDGEIKNLNLAGDFTACNTGKKSYVHMSGLAEYIYENATVTNVCTNLTHKTENFNQLDSVFGLVGYSYGATIEKCLVNDTVERPEETIVYSGICGSFGSSGMTTINNCGVICNLNVADDSKIYGLGRISSGISASITNCYVGGTVSGGDVCPMVRSNLTAYIDFSNNYYLEDMITNATQTTYPTMGTAMTKEQFVSGEVAYLLNSGLTDGTQVWYQNIDNGEPHDTYPLFNGGTVYKNAGTCVSEVVGYTNTLGEITHNYNNYHVCKDCIGLRPGEAAGIYGFSIGLGGNISVQYYMVLDEDVAADETAKMIFTVPDTGSTYDIEIPVSEAVKSGKFHIFECEVAAKEICSDIFCQVVTDTRESDVFRYSVKEYAEVILANPESFEKEIPLVKALLNYGGYAQVAFDYNLTDLANTSANITEEDKLLQSVDFSDYEFSIDGTEEGVTYYGSAISLKSETAIKHYFFFEDEENLPTVTVNGKEVTPVKNGGYYEVKVSDIPAHKLHEMYEVKVGDLTLNYGVFSYCYTASSKTTNQKLIDVANALYAYNQAAVEYIG